MHHSLIHAVHTRHPSASAVARLAHRWIASHMMSDMIPHEAVELMVAKIYTDSAESNSSKLPLADTAPATVTAGFLKWLRLLSSHDWAREPLIVDPQNHITINDRGLIHSQFNIVRGADYSRGPAMYIISPADYDGVEDMSGSKLLGEEENTPQVPAAENIWAPSITANHPESVVLSRASALAKCSHDHLTSCIMRGSKGSSWVAAFQESPASLTSYSALLRVDPSFVTDPGCSSTASDSTIISPSKDDGSVQIQTPFERSLQKRYAGPKELRKKNFKNLVLEKDTLVRSFCVHNFLMLSSLPSNLNIVASLQHEWQPVKSLVSTLRARYNEYAVFFYNEFAPDLIAMIWRPAAFVPQPFSAMVSEFKRPVSDVWKEDTLVITNSDDLMCEIGCASKDIVTTLKVLDDKKPVDVAPAVKRQKKSWKDDYEVSSDEE